MDWKQWTPIEASHVEKKSCAFGSRLQVTLSVVPPPQWEDRFLAPRSGLVTLYDLQLSGRQVSALSEDDETALLAVRDAIFDRIEATNVGFQRDELPGLVAKQRREAELAAAEDRRRADLLDKLNAKKK